VRRRTRSILLSWVEMYRGARWTWRLRAGSPSLLHDLAEDGKVIVHHFGRTA
jgi:hypothetical protein